MSIRKQQSEFAKALGLLILYAYQLGYEITLGDAWARDGHIDGSFHYKRLAIDLNLFIDDVYITDSTGHDKLGAFWKELGGTWGGDFQDPNHYSWGE